MPSRLDLAERLALGRLGRLVDGEQPHHRVGLGDEAARGRLVLGVDRVEPRRVDDVDPLQRLERVEHLDDADARAPRRRRGPCSSVGTSFHVDVARGVVVVDDAAAALGAVLRAR